MDPCPSCGEMLVAPGPADGVENKQPFPVVDTGMQTQIAGDGTPAPPPAPPSVPAASDSRADTVGDEVDVHELPTVADVDAPNLVGDDTNAQGTPAPPAAEVAAADAQVEVTSTETTGRPQEMGKAGETGEASPFGHDSVDEKAPPGADADVLTKTVIEEEASEAAAAAVAAAAPPPMHRAESPDVLTRTIAEEHVVQQEAAAPSPDSLPPLPSPRTPKPAKIATVLGAGAPPLPRSTSSVPPRPASASKAPPIPGSVVKEASRSGVVSSAPPIPAVMASAPAPASAAPPPAADSGSRSGVVSSAPPVPAVAAGVAPATPAGGRPSDVLPRPPVTGRPSDVLPRPPASAVVRPAGPPPGVGGPVPPGVGNPGVPGGVSPVPPMMQGYPAPPGPHSPVPPGMVASPAPPGMMASPVPPGMPNPAQAMAPNGVAPGMMQSFPTPSNVARPPAPGMMQSPVPPGSDQAMAAMPAAYALPGSGYPTGPAAVAMTPNPPLIHTPVPPGLIGPPPDLNEGSNLGAALDSLDQENHRARQDTPSANAVWREAHPSAQRWANKRHGGAVRTPKAGIIAIGLMLAGFGAYLLAIFLPSRQPLTAAKIAEQAEQAGVDSHAWRFSETLIDAANINAALFVLLGVVIVLRGAMYRQQPGGQGRKGMSKPAILLIFCFTLLAVSFGALVMSAST